MLHKITNPFVTGGYAGPGYFCDRQEETDHLLKAIASKRNISLLSLRRMGKTGLLKHVKNILESGTATGITKPVQVVYVDLMPTMNANEMLNAIASAVVHMREKEKNLFERILSLLSTLRPRLSYDQLTGQPSVELKVETISEIQYGLDQLIGFISGIKNEFVFMFDEFQQITQYPEKNVEQVLRTIIQNYPTLPFIFSGSSKHMLEPMFSAAGRPFYQSAELMYLEKIPDIEYRKFIIAKFESQKTNIEAEAIDRIFTLSRLHTYYVQHICNVLYESAAKLIDQRLVNEVFHQILVAHEPLFANYRNLIPGHQYKLLQAIAVENGVTQPTAGEFIKSHNLTSPSSVKTSLKALSEKEMIVRSGNQWLVYDVFFSRWLQHQYGKK